MTDRTETGRSDVHLTIRNHGGSVEHYYHFLLGFFVPMLMAWRDLTASGDVRHIYVRSCAVLDGVIRAAACPEIVILDRAAHQAMADGGQGRDGVPLRRITVEGFDSPDKYQSGDFAGVAAGLRQRLGAEIDRATAEIDRRFTGAGPRIALIDRAPPDPFYASDACEIKGAGAERRSIANFAALQTALASSGGALLADTLEGKSLAWQMALFRRADVVVAQHGAALSNLLWGRPGLLLVELMPDDMPALIYQADFFGALAERLGQTCRKVTQATSHGDADVAAVLQAATTPADSQTGTGGRMEDVTITGNGGGTAMAVTVRAAFDDALIRRGKLPAGVLDINGMSGRKYRYFINNLIERLDNPRYLEVGSWAGSTLCAAIAGNRVQAVAVDDWSQFGGPVAEFFGNVSRFCGRDVRLSVLTSDFRQASVDRPGPFNVYLFDGPHGYQDQYDGLAWAIDNLDEEFVFIVDDWNWARVRNGTFAAMADLQLEPLLQIEVRTTLDESHGRPAGKESDWHNGYFISVLRKGENLLQRWRRRLGPPRRVAGDDDHGPAGQAAVMDPEAALGPQLDRLQRADGVRLGADGGVSIPRDCPSRHALFGPYAHLAPGDYRLEVCLSAGPGMADAAAVEAAGGPDAVLARVEVCAAYGQTLGALDMTAAAMARGPAVIRFAVPEDGEELMIEYRIVHFELADLRVLSMDLEADGEGAPSARLFRDGRVDYLLGPLLPRQSLAAGAVRGEDGSVTAPAGGAAGHIVYGPYLLAPAGDYRLLVRAVAEGDDNAPALVADVAAGDGPALAEMTLSVGQLRAGPVALDFTLPLAVAVDGPAPRPLEVRLARPADAATTILAVDLLRNPAG